MTIIIRNLLSQDQALATFNFLNAEKRYVAGAFIPPSYVEMHADDIPFDPNSLKLDQSRNQKDDIDDDITPILEGKFRKPPPKPGQEN